MKIVRTIFLMSLIVPLLTACTVGRTAFNKAEKFERQGKYDDAVLKYAEAVSANPDIGEYRLRFMQASELAAKHHFRLADEYLARKQYDDAYREYQSAYAMDRTLERAKQQSELVQRYRTSLVYLQEGIDFERENKVREAIRSYQKAFSLNSTNKEAQDALDRLGKMKKYKLDGFDLNLKSTKPITLKFKDAKVKEVFNIISQLSGINFIFDDAIKDTNITIYLENATFQQSLDIITGLNKLNKKILNENTIILYPKSPDKIKQYEDLYVQTFFLNKLDAKKAVNLVRTMLQVKKIYVNEEMNTLVIRDTPDVIEVARKILEANDVPDAEVLLEVEVIELSKKNAENFGLALSKYSLGYNTLSPTGSFFNDTLVSTSTTATGTTATTTTTRSDTSQLLNLFRWGDYRGYVTVPNAAFNFGKTLGNAETLSNPKIRVKNREKAKFNVGTRVPITTTSSNGVGNYNVNVQYVDVGVKVNAEPTIQLNNEVNIKLGLEVSSILSKEKVGTDGNTTVATIGTRNMDTVLSLKDGETSIIGGLIQDTKGKNTSKVFLLGDIPLIGPLFSSHDNANDKTELILAITPRIVRGVAVPEGDVSSFWSGVEDDPSTGRTYGAFVQDAELNSPAQQQKSSAPGVGAVQPAANSQPAAAFQKPVSGEGQAGKPAPAPAIPSLPAATTGSPVDMQGGVQPGKQIGEQAPPIVQPPPPLPAKRVSIRIAAPTTAKLNENFIADILAAEVENLFSAPLTVVFDPILLECISVAEGDFLKKDGKETTVSSKIDNASGQVSLGVTRVATDTGVSGTGRLFSLTFKAKAVGPASIGFIGVKLAAPGGKHLDSILYNSVVEVK
jgi:general secretion pathway protein D